MADVSIALGQNYDLSRIEAQTGRKLTQAELKEYQETGRLPENTVSAFSRNNNLEQDTIAISAAASEAIGGAEEKQQTAAASKAETAAAAASASEREKTAEELKIEAVIAELNTKRDNNLAKIDKIEKHIEDLIKQAENKVEEASNVQEKAVKDYEEESKKAVREQLQKYVEANKSGKGMTKDELKQNIQESVPNAPSLAPAIAAITEADGIADEIDACVSELKPLINEVQSIENEISVQEKALEAAVKAAEEAEKAKKCDPIGFKFNGETYDFIVDDGAFDSTDDFLGSSTNWAAMQALDTNGDNTVDTAELSAGNIKAVKSDGKSVDLAEVFGKDFSINLASYNKNGAYAGLDTADDDSDGALNQELQGTFSLNIGGQTVQGYNTLDDTDWLSSKFGIAEGADTASGMSAAFGGLTLSTELQNHMTKADSYSEKAQEIRAKAQAEYEHLGMTREEINAIDEIISFEAVSGAQNFFASLNKEIEEAEKKEEEKEAEKAQA